jgi:N-methylhydantoinase A
MRIGIDVGGTFTDMVLVDDASGKVSYTKTSTTPKDLAQGVINGIDKILGIAGAKLEDVDYIVGAHGSTIGTNALIERKGAKVGLITTRGFRDVLEIGRVQRPPEGIYDFNVDNPLPLVPRYLRLGVTERVDRDGNVLVPLNEAEVEEAVRFFKSEGVEAVAICFLFSFLNPEHERRAAEICKSIYPEVLVSLSSELAPEFREYERTSTTVLNAYLQPLTIRYIDNLLNRVQAKYGSKIDLRIMQASGGTMAADMARINAVRMVNSGPAGGAMAAAYVGRLTEEDHIVSVDMGGTSFDIGLIVGGTPRITSDSKFEGFPVKIPIVDVHAIGAGGGSIAWLDVGGVLNVGPQSAAADPGPACYRRGGTEPTVTDANVVLGRINPGYFLGGEMELDYDLAYKAIESRIAKPMGISVEDAALGIIKVVNANMEKGISVNSIQKGYDVREFALVAFGGAGPLHAVQLARDLSMKSAIIPTVCGNLSALGLLVSDRRYDYVQTMVELSAKLDLDAVSRIYQELEARGVEQLRSERVADKDIEVHWLADMRYEGQSYELTIPVPRKRRLSRSDIDEVERAFHDAHLRIFAYSSVDEQIEFVNLRVVVVGKTPPVHFPRQESAGPDARPALKSYRKVMFEGLGWVDTPIYERDLLRAGNVVEGPAVIEETVSNTLVLPGSSATVDPYGNLIVKFA